MRGTTTAMSSASNCGLYLPFFMSVPAISPRQRSAASMSTAVEFGSFTCATSMFTTGSSILARFTIDCSSVALAACGLSSSSNTSYFMWMYSFGSSVHIASSSSVWRMSGTMTAVQMASACGFTCFHVIEWLTASCT